MKFLTRRKVLFREVFSFLLFLSVLFFLYTVSFIHWETLDASFFQSVYFVITVALNSFYIFILIVLPILFLCYYILPNLLFRIVFSMLIAGIFTFLAIDKVVYNLFKFHLNAFVFQVIQQWDAWQVLGLTWQDTVAVLSVFFLGFLLSWFGLDLLAKTRLSDRLAYRLRGFLRKAVLGLVILAVFIADRMTFGWLVFQRTYSATIMAASVPFYSPTYINAFFQDELGLTPPETQEPQLKLAGKQIKYPLQPYQPQKLNNRRNIIWLVSDAFRNDVVSSDIMPYTTKFAAEKAIRFQNHFSGSNGTSNGLFSLFYGIHPSYIRPFSRAEKTPIFLEILEQQEYQIDLLASRDLGWFGTEEVIFYRFRDRIQDDLKYSTFDSDIALTQLAIHILKEGKKKPDQKPHFMMMFYDSMHVPHFFHEKYQKFQPAKTGAVFNPTNPAERIAGWNEYKNASHFIDDQFHLFFTFLEKEGFMENTILVITGDHGSEKYEHGHWGHASAFTKEQLQVPMILYYPGVQPQVIEKFTSHVDVVATTLELMGIDYPAEYHSNGKSMLSRDEKEFIVAAGDMNRVLFDDKYKINYVTFSALPYYEVTDFDDDPIPNQKEVIQQYTPQILKMFSEVNRFLR